MHSLIYQKLSQVTKTMRIPILSFDKKLYILLWSIVAITSFHIVYILSAVRPLPNIIFLHKNIYFGVDLLGPWYYIFIFPGVSIALSILNASVSRVCYTKSQMLSYFLIVGALIISIILFIGSAIIINDNI